MGKRAKASDPRVRDYELVGGPYDGDMIEMEDPPVKRVAVVEHDVHTGDYFIRMWGSSFGGNPTLIYQWKGRG